MSEQKAPIIRKEPIQQAWIWVSFFLIILLMVPWYYTEGAVQPIVFGFPLWAFVSLVMCAVLSALISYVLKHYWVMDEEGEVD